MSAVNSVRYPGVELKHYIKYTQEKGRGGGWEGAKQSHRRGLDAHAVFFILFFLFWPTLSLGAEGFTCTNR